METVYLLESEDEMFCVTGGIFSSLPNAKAASSSLARDLPCIVTELELDKVYSEGLEGTRYLYSPVPIGEGEREWR